MHHEFTIMVHSREQLQMLKGLRTDRKIDVFLKFNTGMNRLGFPAADSSALLREVESLPCAGKVVLTTHFSEAEGVSGIDWLAEEPDLYGDADLVQRYRA